jgi:hypothetical protein
MKSLASLLVILSLVGCSTFTQKEVLVQNVYVVRSASAAQKTIPPYNDPIDVSKATQIDLSKWIVASEKRTWELESLIAELIKFYEQPVTEADRAKLAADVKAAATKASEQKAAEGK